MRKEAPKSLKKKRSKFLELMATCRSCGHAKSSHFVSSGCGVMKGRFSLCDCDEFILDNLQYVALWEAWNKEYLNKKDLAEE